MEGVRQGDDLVATVADTDAAAQLPVDHVRIRTTHVLVDEADRRTGDGPRWIGAGAVGEVVGTGADVDDGIVGTNVLVTGPAPCGRCATCRRGQPYVCLSPSRDGAATRGIGGARVHMTLPASRTTPVPTGLSPTAATLLGGAALTGAAAVRSAARLVPGERVAVVGDVAATVGALVARAAGARQVVALPLAEEDGPLLAAHGVATATSVAEFVTLGAEVTEGTGVDALVVAGAPGGLVSRVLDVARPGGTVVVVDPEGEVPNLPLTGGRTLVDAPFGAADPSRDLPWLVALALDGAVPLDQLLAPGGAGLAAAATAVRSPTGGRRTVHALP